MNTDESLRAHLIFQLKGGGAHMNFDDAFGDIPPKLRGARPERIPYTPWRLLEHMRIAQSDILEFIRNPDHVSPDYPDGYWPESDAPPDSKAWEASLQSFRKDLKEIEALVTDPDTDLFEPIPHGSGQTVLREALLVADHNSYHLGEVVVVRTLLGIEPEE